MGHIEYSGDITARLTANCSMGDITLKLARPESYGYTADVSLGSIKIDGSHRGSGFSSGSYGGDQSARPFYDLDCGLGNITISFT